MQELLGITPNYGVAPELVAPLLTSPGVLAPAVPGLDPDDAPGEPYVDQLGKR